MDRKSAMSLGLRNTRGEEAPSFTASEAKQEFGRVLEAALQHGVVAITKYDHVKAVVLSVDEFDRLRAARASKLETLSAEFDEQLARMQRPGVRARMQSAFEASPAELGAAAVKAAKQPR